jgi:hypothetical protein
MSTSLFSHTSNNTTIQHSVSLQVPHQSIRYGDNFAHSAVYEANEREWGLQYFESVGIPVIKSSTIQSEEQFVQSIMKDHGLSTIPYFLVLLVQLQGTLPEGVLNHGKIPQENMVNISVENITVTDKDCLVVTQCPFFAETWKNTYDDYQFPNSKESKTVYKWAILFVIGPFVHLSTVNIFHRAWLNNAQGFHTKVTKCFGLVEAFNGFFRQRKLVEYASSLEPKGEIDQTHVQVKLYLTPMPLQKNFTLTDINLFHFNHIEKEEEYKEHLKRLSKIFPSLQNDLEEFVHTSEFVWKKWTIRPNNEKEGEREGEEENNLEAIPLGSPLSVLGDFM